MSMHRANADVPEDSSELFSPVVEEWKPNDLEDRIVSFVFKDQSKQMSDDHSDSGVHESASSAKRS